MGKQLSSKQVLSSWLEKVMADKVMFACSLDKKLCAEIGLADNTLDNLVRIVREASRELVGSVLSTGTISDILIEKKNGVWKIVVFKTKVV